MGGENTINQESNEVAQLQTLIASTIEQTQLIIQMAQRRIEQLLPHQILPSCSSTIRHRQSAPTPSGIGINTGNLNARDSPLSHCSNPSTHTGRVQSTRVNSSPISHSTASRVSRTYERRLRTRRSSTVETLCTALRREKQSKEHELAWRPRGDIDHPSQQVLNYIKQQNTLAQRH